MTIHSHQPPGGKMFDFLTKCVETLVAVTAKRDHQLRFFRCGAKVRTSKVYMNDGGQYKAVGKALWQLFDISNQITQRWGRVLGGFGVGGMCSGACKLYCNAG